MVAGKPTTKSPVLDDTTGAFVKALASDSRQRIMALLADGVSLTVNEITPAMRAQPARHLRTARDHA